MKALLEKFVCVRAVQMWGVDLAKFQFDTNLTWTAFFLNGDGAIYGRYGARSAHDAGKDVSVEGFLKAGQGALELHAGYPANRASLAGKTGKPFAWKTAETLPSFAGRFKPGDTSRMGCIHCHFVGEGLVKSSWHVRKPVPDSLLWSWPMPDAVGLSMDVRERATVASVRAESAAAEAGFRNGDRIVSLGGQPPISIADVQWVLHTAPEPGEVKAEVERDGKRESVTLRLAKGWRRGTEFAWRDPTYGIRPGIFVEPAPDDEKRKAGLAASAPALRVKETHVEWGKVAGRKIDAGGAGLRKGDLIVTVDGAPAPATESAFIAHAWQKKKPGEVLELGISRAGRREVVRVPMP